MSNTIQELADVTGEDDAAKLAAAGEGQLLAVLQSIRGELARRNEFGIVTVMQSKVAEEPELTGVVTINFGVEEWDNGWFFTESNAAIIYADGRKDVWSFDEDVAYPDNNSVREVLTELSSDYGPLTSASELTVDLVSETVSN